MTSSTATSAATLTPHDHPFGAKRPCLDTGYYATFNRPNVTLVDLRHEPITSITASGIRTAKSTHDVDVIIFATGFDAMTGAVLAIHPIAGRGGVALSDAWAGGPKTYLGLTVAGFAFVYGVWMIVDKIIWGNAVPGYPSLLVSILFLGGIQLIGIGVLGEYIGRIYIETKQRPRYVIRTERSPR